MKAIELQETLRRLSCMSKTQFFAVLQNRFIEESYIERHWMRMNSNLGSYVLEIDAELLQKLISYSNLT